MTEQRKSTVITAMYGAILALITYYISMDQLEIAGSDFWGHVYTYIPMLKGDAGEGGWMAVPYFLWHLVTLGFHGLTVPMKAAAAFSSCVFAVFGFYVLYWMTDRVAAAQKLGIGVGVKSFIAFALSVVQPVYMYWFDAVDQYLGQFSMNPLHNPTHMCVKPFSILCLCITYDILQHLTDPDHKGVFIHVADGVKKACIWLAVLLLLSCMAKPTFAEMFIPTVGILMLAEWIKRILQKDGTAKAYFNKCLMMLLVSAPALIYIMIQFLAYFILGGSYGGEDGSLTVTAWMEVWRMFSENVAASILLGMGFPLLIVIVNGAYFVKDILGRLALVGYGVGLLECALLGESGEKLSHGDFLWPMMSGMTLLWVVATMRFLVLDEKQNQTKAQRIFLHAAWLVLCMYVLFGGLYIGGQLMK